MTPEQRTEAFEQIIEKLVHHGVCPNLKRKDCTDCQRRIKEALASLWNIFNEGGEEAFTNVAGKHIPGKFGEVKTVGWFDADGNITGWYIDAKNDLGIAGITMPRNGRTLLCGYTVEQLFQVWLHYHKQVVAIES